MDYTQKINELETKKNTKTIEIAKTEERLNKSQQDKVEILKNLEAQGVKVEHLSTEKEKVETELQNLIKDAEECLK
jgi:predicted  nucleic acid-binding Zn-ribbon protein